MVESTCILHTIQSSRQVNRIISKEEEREDIQGEILQSSSTVFPHTIHPFYKELHVIPQVSSHPVLELILLQEISKKYYNYKAHPVHTDRRHPPASAPHVSKHSSRQNKTPGSPTSIPGPYSTSRLSAILPGRNSILSGSQHPRSPYSSSQANFTRIHLVLQESTWYYRILPGEIGFTSKGLSIVYPCNTKVSVFQFAYSCFRIILQEY